jgi:hypothetical protein
VLTELIRGLGSNKTEHAIITISKVAPVIAGMPRLSRCTFSMTAFSNSFLAKVKGVLLIPSKFVNALPSFSVQGSSLTSSLKIWNQKQNLMKKIDGSQSIKR